MRQKSLVLGILGGLVWLTYIVRAAAGSTDTAAERPAVPNVLLADGSGLPVALSRYLGQVVLLEFWAEDCGPCLKEMVFLNRLQGDFPGSPLAVLAVAENAASMAAVKSALARQKFPFLRPIGDPGGTAAQVFRVRGLPTSFLIDRHGRLALQLEGPQQWDSPAYEARVRQLLSEP